MTITLKQAIGRFNSSPTMENFNLLKIFDQIYTNLDFNNGKCINDVFIIPFSLEMNGELLNGYYVLTNDKKIINSKLTISKKVDVDISDLKILKDMAS